MTSIPYGRQQITEEDIAVVTEVLRSDFLTQGPKIEEFENKFASYIGSKYAVAVANGTAALHLCALALNVSKGDKVITTPITFSASANCIRYCDGEVIFSDIDQESFLLDLDKLEIFLSKNPNLYKGIIPVDFAGKAVNLERLKTIAEKHGLWIIEDACHAPGGFFVDSEGKRQNCGNGNFADLAIFSFHPVKHIATGEGGMITTNRKDLYEKLILLRTHGITKNPALLNKNDGGWYYEMQELGYNYRLSDMQAALGISQLSRADKGLEERKKIAEKYNMLLRGLPLTLPSIDQGHALHLYIIQTDRRKDLYDYLRSKNIFCQVHYVPVHTMPYYEKLGWRNGDFPVAESYYNDCLSLPMFPSLTEKEQTFVIDSIIEFFNN